MYALKYSLIATAILLFLFDFFAPAAHAQSRVSYFQLANRAIAPPIFLDYHTVKSSENDETTVWFDFKIPYNTLQFRSSGSGTFASETELIITIREGELPSGDRSLSTSFLDRIFWTQRVTASSFDETSSTDKFVSGVVKKNLPPGTYHYSVRLRTDGINRDFRSLAREFTITDRTGRDSRIFFSSVSDTPTEGASTLGLGRAIPYAKDFGLFFMIPDGVGSDNLRVKVFEAERSQSEVTRRDLVFEQAFSSDDLFNAGKIEIENHENTQNVVRFAGGDTFSYAYMTIPNNRFRNTGFEVVIFDGETEIASRAFQTLWIDIPRSLLNVDVAIANMEPILDQDTFRELRRGNQQARERKFREFWNERDPEPERYFNPLMVEYFSRVDQAFRRFSTPNTPGFQSDRGKVFLRNGEPDRIERFFPTNAPATEVWTYGSRRFVFEATTGFGDYVLRN